MGKLQELTPTQISNLSEKEVLDILSEKMKLFCRHYIINFNATASARDAGYAEGSAHAKGLELKNHPICARYIELLMQNRLTRLEISADRVVTELAKIGFFNIKSIYDDDGNLIPIKDLPPNVSAGISKIKEKVLMTDNETMAKVLEREYQFHNKVEALRDLGKHTGIYEKDNKQKTAQVMAYIPDNNRGDLKDEK